VARLVECVPNFSEGRRPEVVDALAAAVAGVPGVHLLDRTSDPDHNRSVLTLAGPAGPVQEAMAAAVGVAVERIDMERHHGQHPRIGAVDVIPFVPLGDTQLGECVEIARAFGARIAALYGLPVYLYAEAALRDDRRVLADLRRPQYEGLREQIVQHGREPDFGPARMHPPAGAVAAGARPFLIAWNINLESDDLDLARRLARRVRERSGGLPRVQALGLELADRGCAQVSMNLLDFAVTPVWLVWETVRDLAASEGVSLRESELVGLAPLAALLDIADHIGAPAESPLEARLAAGAAWLRLRDFTPTMALELRLAAAEREAAEQAPSG
jgi:glutamate formiminotransferase